MTFKELASDRYSVRRFKPEHLRQKDIDYILECAAPAPTAANRQPQRILVLNTDRDCEKLKDCSASQSHAPAAMLVCYDKNECWTRRYDGQDSGQVDCSIVTTHLMLAAREIGVGTVWVMSFDPEKTRRALDIPENLVPVAFLMMGYPAEDAAPTANHTTRHPLDKTVFYGKY